MHAYVCAWRSLARQMNSEVAAHCTDVSVHVVVARCLCPEVAVIITMAESWARWMLGAGQDAGRAPPPAAGPQAHVRAGYFIKYKVAQ